MWGKYRHRRMKNKLKMGRIDEMRIFVVLRMGEGGEGAISAIFRGGGGGPGEQARIKPHDFC